jgi:hypothetical protein
MREIRPIVKNARWKKRKWFAPQALKSSPNGARELLSHAKLGVGSMHPAFGFPVPQFPSLRSLLQVISARLFDSQRFGL